jgi:hypothetical protein
MIPIVVTHAAPPCATLIARRHCDNSCSDHRQSVNVVNAVHAHAPAGADVGPGERPGDTDQCRGEVAARSRAECVSQLLA